MFRTYIVRVGNTTYRCSIGLLVLAYLYHSMLNLISRKQSFRVIGSYVR